jgi:hypothetical protein
MWPFKSGKRKKPENSYDFDENDVEFSAKLRKIQAEARNLKKQLKITDAMDEVRELQDELSERIEETTPEQPPMTFESILTSIILPQIMGTAAQKPAFPTLSGGNGMIESMTPIMPEPHNNAGNMDISGIIKTINTIPGPVLKSAISAGLKQKGIEREEAVRAIEKLMEAV